MSSRLRFGSCAFEEHTIVVKYGNKVRVCQMSSEGCLSYSAFVGVVRKRFDLPEEKQICLTYKYANVDVELIDEEALKHALGLDPLLVNVSLDEPDNPAAEDPTHDGAPSSKKAKLSLDYQQAETQARADKAYFEELLEPPAVLPVTPAELQGFLKEIPVKLPVRDRKIFDRVSDCDLLTLDVPEGSRTLPSVVESILDGVDPSVPPNEATSSCSLFAMTGEFLKKINAVAPLNRRLGAMLVVMDSPNPASSLTASKPLRALARPDLQLFVMGCLMLRWENKTKLEDFAEAELENTEKLKIWSRLFYGDLPYVVGGACAGRQFRWLRLAPGRDGKGICSDIISPSYDLTSVKGVAAFLHSNIRVHRLLQKLQEILQKSEIKVVLYRPIEREGDVTVTIYPEFVSKVVSDGGTCEMRESLYNAIQGSKYLIQGKLRNKRNNKIELNLEPVGEPNPKPGNMNELKNAIHDILCGLADLHKAGYTHRDIRWENCIKVNVEAEMKWILIDLEAAGADNEERHDSDRLKVWDDKTLARKGRKKLYTKASDIYLLGKLIDNWLDDRCGRDKDGYQDMKAMGEKMMKKHLSAVKLKKDLCRQSCQRCRKFGKSFRELPPCL